MADDQSLPLVVFTPSGKRGRFPAGTPVLSAARSLGVDLDSVCGGRGICSKCQCEPAYGHFPKHGVTVEAGALGPWGAVEQRYHEKRGLTPGRRLGCQATIQGDVVIDVPPESQLHRQVVRKDAAEREIVLDPATRLVTVTVAEPDMHAPTGDAERLCEALARESVADLEIGLGVLRALQPALRAGGWRVTAAVHRDHRGGPARVLRVWPGEPEGTVPGLAPPGAVSNLAPGGAVLGLAIDVGSTTIAGHLCDLRDGRVIASGGAMNPQIRFGEDLMSRVSYAMLNPGGAEAMTRAILAAIDTLAADLAAEAGAAPSDVLEAVVVANPVMHHLLLGIDPVELGGAPFALATSASLSLAARDLGLSLAPEARAYVLPCIAGHVGADAAAVALSEALHERDDLTLVVDVGTNAEILLGDRRRVVACSSPTGPAFEGAQISAGQRAAPGAIERVRIDPETRAVRFRVIGCDLWSDEPGFAAAVGPRGVTGICGSGIIEAIAEMRLAGVIDADGAIGPAESLGERVIADGRTRAFVLADARATGGAPVTVTQNDVRAIQLAKAALYAGARLLMDTLGVERVDRVVLAGAFGAHISPKHALVLGMIPDCAVEAVTAVGNAAGTGARIALLNRAARAEVERIVREIEKVETALEPRFQKHFVAAMAVPHKTAPYERLRDVATLPAVRWDAGGAAEGEGRRRRRRERA
ncbi:MAG: ASKHA domain-containing protein [Paracoccaceae bacterium]